MKGVVRNINSERGVLAIETDEGYSLCELLSDNMALIGDVVECECHPLGTARVVNHSTGQTLRVYFQDHRATEERALDFVGP